MTISISTATAVYIVIAIVLLILTFYPREKGSGYLGDWSQITNVFWGIVLVIFTAIYGGVFWW